MARPSKIRLEIKSPATLDRVHPANQGAALYIDGGPKFDAQDLSQIESATVLFLDGIEDPHNLGAILRTAWLTGVQGVVIPKDRAVGLSPTVHKVACGGAEHVPVHEVANFTGVSEELKAAGFWIFGLSHEAKKSVFDLTLPEKVVWVVGSEERGLRTTTVRLCDELVHLPQIDNAASYNASVAAAAVLLEGLRQRRTKPKPPKSQ